MTPPDPRNAVIQPGPPGPEVPVHPGHPGDRAWSTPIHAGPPIGPLTGSAGPEPAAGVRGDHRGAWRAAVVSVGGVVLALYLAGLCLTLIYAAVAGDLPGRALLTVPAAGVATSLGATWSVTLGGQDFGDIFSTGRDVSYEVRAYPLLLTALGVLLLARLVRRRFNAGVCAATLGDRLSQAARVGLLLGVTSLLFAVMSRQTFGTGHINARYPLAFIAGVLVGAGTVAVVALCHHPAQAPNALRRLAAEVAEPLVALRVVVPLIVLLGMLQLIGVLIFGRADDGLTALGLDTADSRSLGIALLVPFAPNVSWMLFGMVVGAPLNMSTGLGFGGARPTSLVDLARASGWWWLAPLAIFVMLFAAGTLLALRSPNSQVARHRIGVWALSFGAASLVLSYLGTVTVQLRGSLGDLTGSVGNQPVLVLVLSSAWALLSGLGAVALVARLAPDTRARWANLVRPAGSPAT